MVDIDKIVEYISKKVPDTKGSIGVIIGPCFSDFLDEIENKVELYFRDIPDMKILGSDREENKLIFGTINGRKIIVSLGRLHYYLGYDQQDVAVPVFLLKELGCEKLIISSSVGAINHKLKVGDIVTFTDHINFTGRNPLYGLTFNKYGHKFIDMIDAYDQEMIDMLVYTAKNEMAIKVKKGIAIEFPGPSAETVSETKLALSMGGDIIGFNICSEIIAAKYCGLPVCTYALITNHASAFTNSKIKHEDIVYNRKCASTYYLELLSKFIKNV
ncbi:MAG: purine-nucleoside phosphorylase [Clostridia bacterium]|nr:purine-nucleoside phosphorylase [Clostridia bacterium]